MTDGVMLSLMLSERKAVAFRVRKDSRAGDIKTQVSIKMTLNERSSSSALASRASSEEEEYGVVIVFSDAGAKKSAPTKAFFVERLRQESTDSTTKEVFLSMMTCEFLSSATSCFSCLGRFPRFKTNYLQSTSSI